MELKSADASSDYCNHHCDMYQEVDMDEARTVIVDGCVTPWDVAVSLMDDKIREQLQTQDLPSDQAFLDAYAEAHRRKFGEPFCIA